MLPREGLRERSRCFAPLGLGGDGERFRMLLSRRDCAKDERRAGSSRGPDITEVREDFFLSRRGERDCVGVATLGDGAAGIAGRGGSSSSSMDFSLLKRESSE